MGLKYRGIIGAKIKIKTCKLRELCGIIMGSYFALRLLVLVFGAGRARIEVCPAAYASSHDLIGDS